MATSSSLLVIIPFLTLFFVLSSSVSGFNTRVVGGKTRISNVKEDKEVQDLGRFSVEEFNRMYGHGGNEELVFSKVVEAQKQVVSGIKYYLRVEATQNGLSGVFDSVVVVKPWAHSKELVSFSPISER